mgnify:FL=1
MVLDEIGDLAYISENIKLLRDTINEYGVRYSRNPDDIVLIGVSKTYPAQAAAAAVRAGLNDLGENRAEELSIKSAVLAAHDLKPAWHMIGTLQRRKVRHVIGVACLIHSVDSMRILDEISSRAAAEGVCADILLEVNISGEENKHGFSPAEIYEVFENTHNIKDGIRVRGIMTMAPFTDNELVIEKVFEQAKVIFDNSAPYFPSGESGILSMGMSNDYKLAIKHGATHLRIGTAIFGKR